MSKAPSHWIVAGGAAIVGICLWAGLATRQRKAVEVATSGPYVGAQACAECHREIFERQAHSNHALTLRPGNDGEFPREGATPAVLRDKQTGLDYRIVSEAGSRRQVVSYNAEQVASANLDYLLGSGHHGISPMSFDGAEWRYLSLTYYAGHGWDFSPMHGLGNASVRRKNAAGWPVAATDLEKCFGCHTTRLAFRNSALDPERTELGVRCETCHGPGRAHMEAKRARVAGGAIQNPHNWSGASFMALCQQCHNETATLEGTLMGIPRDPASPGAVKYHVYGLSQSRCFKVSAGKMRCTTCHDPHSNSETQPAFYEVKCRSCHAPETQGQVSCRVKARSGCLTCHMPKVRVEKYTYFADHWIRARSPFAPKAGRSASAAVPR